MMKDTILTAALALSLGMAFMASTFFQTEANARDNFSLCPIGQLFEINRDGTKVWSRGRIVCTVNYGTRVRVRGCSNSSEYSPVRITLEGRSRSCHGVVNRQDIREIIENSGGQEVFTTGRWGEDVPVFSNRSSYFNARDRNKFENIVCRLQKGQRVDFKPFKDWGLGEVKAGNCQGWIDRGVIR